MKGRYRITISRDGIDKGDARPILVEDTGANGRTTQAAGLRIDGPSRVVFDPAGLANGARVWIETDTEPREAGGACLGCGQPIDAAHKDGCAFERSRTVNPMQTRIAPV